MGRKTKEKKKKKLQAVKNNGPVTRNTTVDSARPDQPDLSHLFGDWREFYRQVIDQLR